MTLFLGSPSNELFPILNCRKWADYGWCGSQMGGSAKGQTFTHFEKYLPNTQVPELLIYDETQYVVDRLDEVKLLWWAWEGWWWWWSTWVGLFTNVAASVLYLESLSFEIDFLQVSRKLFPLSFLATSVCYWWVFWSRLTILARTMMMITISFLGNKKHDKSSLIMLGKTIIFFYLKLFLLLGLTTSY